MPHAFALCSPAIAFGHGPLYVYRKYFWHLVCGLVLALIYLAMTFGTFVPGADCGYGKLNQECNAAGVWDRDIIGVNHLYRFPTLQRSPECTGASKAWWCDRPFDPEGMSGARSSTIHTLALTVM